MTNTTNSTTARAFGAPARRFMLARAVPVLPAPTADTIGRLAGSVLPVTTDRATWTLAPALAPGGGLEGAELWLEQPTCPTCWLKKAARTGACGCDS